MEIKITLDDDLAGYTFTEGKKTVFFENLTRQQQIHICNAFAQGYNLFVKHIKPTTQPFSTAKTTQQ